MQGQQSNLGNSTSQNQSTKPQPETKAAPSKSVTADGYTVRKGEENLYHLELEKHAYVEQAPPHPPKKVSEPFTAKYHAGDYRRFLEDNPRLGFFVNKVLHDPDTVQTEKIHAEIEAAKVNKKRLSN
jgi:hypothetical protein